MRMDGSRGAATRSPGLGANGMMQSQPMCRPRIERHYASSELLKNRQPTRKESRLRGVVSPRTRESSKGAGGADRIRTDDPLLAKQMLSQLSYSPAARILRPRVLCRRAVQYRRSFESWWVWLELNQRPPPYQDGALTN